MDDHEKPPTNKVNELKKPEVSNKDGMISTNVDFKPYHCANKKC